MDRRTILTASVAGLGLMSLAMPVSGWAASTSAAGDQAVIAPVNQLDTALIALMHQGSKHAPFKQRYDVLMPVVAKTYDLDLILSESVGLLWPQVPPAQQATLQRLFAAYTVATYVKSFDGYDGQRFTVSKNVRVSGARRVVTSHLVPKSGKPIALDYVMTPRGGKWRITDVLFEGTISKVAVQRSDFSGLVVPGSAAKLIAALRKKIDTLSGGTIKVS